MLTRFVWPLASRAVFPPAGHVCVFFVFFPISSQSLAQLVSKTSAAHLDSVPFKCLLKLSVCLRYVREKSCCNGAAAALIRRGRL